MEQTCILIKPDGVCKHKSGKVLDRLENAGLRLVALKMLRLTRQQAEQFYEEHRGKPFYEPLIKFMTSAPIIATAWQGEKAITQARGLMGATDSAKAEPGTLRREFGTDNRYNFVHGSDSAPAAEREIKFFFGQDGIFEYDDQDWKK